MITRVRFDYNIKLHFVAQKMVDSRCHFGSALDSETAAMRDAQIKRIRELVATLDDQLTVAVELKERRR